MLPGPLPSPGPRLPRKLSVSRVTTRFKPPGCGVVMLARQVGVDRGVVADGSQHQQRASLQVSVGRATEKRQSRVAG